MDSTTNYMKQYYEETSKAISPGKSYTLYYAHCIKCNVYKRIYSNPVAAPGGTLSCPYCKDLNQNGPGLEGSYGRVVCTGFKIILPLEIFNEIKNE
jgi:hypothetical protein